MYFGRKHRDTLLAVRERTGDPTAQPTADELAADQMVLQEVLRRICADSGACVVIVDQIGAKGNEDREENELGRVLPADDRRPGILRGRDAGSVAAPGWTGRGAHLPRRQEQQRRLPNRPRTPQPAPSP